MQASAYDDGETGVIRQGKEGETFFFMEDHRPECLVYVHRSPIVIA